MSAQQDLWKDWIIFRENNTLELRKQGSDKQNDKFQDFSTRATPTGSPSLQEFYEALLNGTMIRSSLNLYKGKKFNLGIYQYYLDLQNCFVEYCKQVNYKQKILVEIFQKITNLSLSKDQIPQIVVTCNYCNTFIYINFHCKKCYSVYYCDISCLKNDKVNQLIQANHDQECELMQKSTPGIFYPLQIEVHCGQELKEDIIIKYEDEQRITLKYRGETYLQGLFSILQNHEWFQINDYKVVQDTKQIRLEKTKPSQKNIEDDDEYFQKNIALQELKLIFLNQGGLLQDVVKEIYETYSTFVHIYYLPS